MKTPRLFDGGGSRWFNIPAHRPFAEDLARGLYDALAPLGPEALSQATILTPTRRGARALADAFVAAGGGRAVLPPQIRPLGDLDEGEPPFEPGDIALDLPSAIEPLRRRFELTRLVQTHQELLDRRLDASAALELADALGSFLESLQIEEADPGEGLADLVSADLAEHWRVSREFLEAALADWPVRLAELGLVDVSQRRVALLRRLAESWSARPPQGILVAAGSTGTAPATADLLAVIAAAPQGCVVLPGLDESLADRAWANVGEQHPQGAMRRLLARAGVDRGEVRIWPASSMIEAQGRWRRRVINEALRPAQDTADWLHVIERLRDEAADEGTDPIAVGLQGLSLAVAQSEDEAATVAALLLREALETPERTAALVSPDQGMARRVVAKLSRWGIAPDSSAGEPLAGCHCGVLAGLVAKAAVDALDPVVLLAIVKHPYVRLGLAPEALAERREVLERHALRGPRAKDWQTLHARLQAARLKEKDPSAAARIGEAAELGAALRETLAALELPWTGDTATPAEASRTVAEVMEALCRGADGSLGELWAGHGGECMARLLGALMRESDGLPECTRRAFADLLERLMEGETVRSGGATHPRLRILGAIEARLTRADLLIVAGLEEGVWPKGAPLDPFLSRPMRAKIGLPPPERRVGLAAHDFAQAACAPDVVLLHTERREGAPAIKSRWLWRLETLARGAGVEIPERQDVVALARNLDRPGDYRPAKRPAPVPPVADRPRQLAVTRVEALTRDPYAVWARDILKFYRLERPAEPVEARARGSAIHKAFERLTLAYPAELGPRAAADFEAFYLEELEAAGMPHEALARESALAKEAAAWVADLELRRRANHPRFFVEARGSHTLNINGHSFTLTAIADRIEVGDDGFGHILDYKTGKAPSKKLVQTGFSPQLTLTAAILARGGFPDIGPVPPGELTYLEITGRRPAGREEVRAYAGEESLDAAEHAFAGLQALIARYQRPDQAFVSRTAPQFVHDYAGDYGHLARVFEWSTSGEEGEGE